LAISETPAEATEEDGWGVEDDMKDDDNFEEAKEEATEQNSGKCAKIECETIFFIYSFPLKVPAGMWEMKI
jgi:hypothetical protein